MAWSGAEIMVIIKDIKSYRKLQERRIKAIMRAGDRSALAAANVQIARSRQLAPHLTGETISGIRKRKQKSGKYLVISSVSAKTSKKGAGYKFRQNLWANQSPPWIRPRMWWNDGKPTLFNYRGAQFWDRAIVFTRKRFGRITKRKVRQTLRATV